MVTNDVTKITLASYADRAEAFWEGTRDHDVAQNVDAMLRYIDGPPPFKLLDFGCGPGRDLKTFNDLGHTAIGVEGVARFVEMARAHSGCQVWHQNFLALDLPRERFDGVFANASLFHVPRSDLPRVLNQLNGCLKSGGVLFSSNPRGNDEEGWRGQAGDRYGVTHRLSSWRRYMLDAGFAELTHFYRPEGLPQEQQPWLASVWRRIA